MPRSISPDFKPARIMGLLMVATCSVVSICCLWNGPMTAGRMPSAAVGKAPIRTTSVCDSSRWFNACPAVLSASSTLTAWVRNCSPGSVNCAPRRPRSKSRVPVSCSSSFSVLERAGWLRLRVSAARPNVPCCATATKV